MPVAPNEHKTGKGGGVFLRVAFFLFTVICLAEGQEIRRALPVQPPASTVAPVIRRALPVYPTNSPAPVVSPAGPTATPLPAGPPLPSASVNDTARFLAGLPVGADSPLLPLTQNAAWQQHAAVFDKAWARLDARQFSGIRTWEASYFPQMSGPLSTVYYMFSGPDFLYAHEFFPNASTYILAGTEPIGPLPDLSRITAPGLAPALENFESALNSVLRFSFFITKDMKTDLQRNELKGTLPIFYVFLARAGKTITDISFITLDKSGNPRINSSGVSGGSLIPGVRITFTGGAGGGPQTLYYFTTDLSDDAIHRQPGFMKFCAGQGIGYSLLKSASYLMFEQGFQNVRDFLLTHSQAIVQDDSGIPINDFDPAKWDVRLFGNYIGPIELFQQHFQPQLQSLYQSSHPPPLGFGLGYHWRRDQSAVIVALHK